MSSAPVVTMCRALSLLDSHRRQQNKVTEKRIDDRASVVVNRRFPAAKGDERAKLMRRHRGRAGDVIREANARKGGSSLTISAWDWLVNKVAILTGVPAQRLEDFAGRVTLDCIEGFEDLVLILNGLDERGETDRLLNELWHEFPKVAETASLPRPLPPRVDDAAAPAEPPANQQDTDAKGESGARGADGITLDPEDVDILNALAKAGTTLDQFAIEGTTGIARKTIGIRLKRLRDAGLTHRPNGTKGGDAISMAGQRALRRCGS